MHRSLLVAVKFVDGRPTQNSLLSAETAVDVAGRTRGTRLTFVTAVSNNEQAASPNWTTLDEMARTGGVTPQQIVRVGPAAEVLSNAAIETEADVLVLGPEEPAGRPHSIELDLRRRLECDLLRWTASAPDDEIVVIADAAGRDAEHVLDHAVAQCHRLGAGLVAASAIREEVGPADAERTLREQLGFADAGTVAMGVQVRIGHEPRRDVIAELTEEFPTHLLVTTSHDANTRESLLLLAGEKTYDINASNETV